MPRRRDSSPAVPASRAVGYREEQPGGFVHHGPGYLYDVIYWVDAESDAALAGAFARVATHLAGTGGGGVATPPGSAIVCMTR